MTVREPFPISRLNSVMRKLITLCLLLIPLLAGCDTIDSHHARQDQETLVGMSKADFYSCAGLPNRSRTISGFEYDTWDYQPFSSDSFTPAGDWRIVIRRWQLPHHRNHQGR